ncbi:unnamed protein product [Aureobasidium mustum]|uniref:Uncharacterized protein n=1 Tax=Aureobasidium mustum TaxID=2773714 RepID=A0A9N8JY64_9PEZI|nr:unnamed protein product [Aureobasidium mustum]
MSADTPPVFDYLDKLPREIRDMIFGYMILNSIRSYVRQRETPAYKLLCDPPVRFPLLGFHLVPIRSHLVTSPWVTLNKQYCVEYLKVFLEHVRIHDGITKPWVRGPPEYGSNERKPDILEGTLQLINHRFSVAAPHTGIKAAKEALFPHIKGICFNYYYQCSWFRRGFGKREYNDHPDRDYFVKPVEVFRRSHEEYNIPSDRISIELWYGDPTGSIEACLQTLDRHNNYSVVSLRPLHAKIFVDDYDASVAVLDSELEVLRRSFGKIIEKMCIRFPEPHQLGDILDLEIMVEEDMVWLRKSHLYIITETTNFWKTRDGWYDLGDMFKIAESWSSEIEE